MSHWGILTEQKQGKISRTQVCASFFFYDIVGYIMVQC